jgi:hypothetical protein
MENCFTGEKIDNTDWRYLDAEFRYNLLPPGGWVTRYCFSNQIQFEILRIDVHFDFGVTPSPVTN